MYRARYLTPRSEVNPRRYQARGFTLIEIIVVVVIISILAVIAVPQITSRMRERRAQQAGQEIAVLFQTARMRAMGRGSAVMVRYSSTTGWDVREAVEGKTAALARSASENCAPQPVSSCTTNPWNVAERSREITRFHPQGRSEYSGVETAVRLRNESATTSVTSLEVCFTPLGRTFMRSNSSQPLTPMTGIAEVEVKRTASGRTRNVLLLPNGTARVAL